MRECVVQRQTYKNLDFAEVSGGVEGHRIAQIGHVIHRSLRHKLCGDIGMSLQYAFIAGLCLQCLYVRLSSVCRCVPVCVCVSVCIPASKGCLGFCSPSWRSSTATKLVHCVTRPYLSDSAIRSFFFASRSTVCCTGSYAAGQK